MGRREILDTIYASFDEDRRLSASRQGQLEYLTTMHYIHRFVPHGSRVLEVGAGTGRYSVELAKDGFDVTAVELVERNFELLRRNARGVAGIRVLRGDATDLGVLAGGSFDAVLLLGPMYHLYRSEDHHRALDEAIRVARPGGVLMCAFISVHAILYANYLSGSLREGLDENFDEDYRVRHFEEQGFTGFDVDEIEALFANKPVERLVVAGTDSVLELAEQRIGFRMSDEEFELFADYHLHSCEKPELLGSNSHLLHIGRKRLAGAG